MEGNVGLKKWSKIEDLMLCFYIEMHGAGKWDVMARELDIGTSGSSCRHLWYSQLTRKAVKLGHIVRSLEFLQFMRARVQAAVRGGGGGSATTAVDPSSTTTGVAASSGDCEAILREIEAHLMRDD